MKKLTYLLFVLTIGLTMLSCSKDEDKPSSDNPTPSADYKTLIVGRWKTVEGNYYEVYDSNGNGHAWDEDDDVNETEADNFTWSLDANNQSKMTQFYTGEMGQVIPQSCNILTLNETTFKYNNEALRATYDMRRVTE